MTEPAAVEKRAPWSDERHAAVKARCAAASSGPWKWREDQFRPKYMRRIRNNRGAFGRDWIAKKGCRSDDSWLMLLTAPSQSGYTERTLNVTEEDILRGRIDEYDFRHIIGIRWNMLRVKSVFNAVPMEADAAFIEEARTDLPDALAEIERLRAELAALKADV